MRFKTASQDALSFSFHGPSSQTPVIADNWGLTAFLLVSYSIWTLLEKPTPKSMTISLICLILLWFPLSFRSLDNNFFYIEKKKKRKKHPETELKKNKGKKPWKGSYIYIYMYMYIYILYIFQILHKSYNLSIGLLGKVKLYASIRVGTVTELFIAMNLTRNIIPGTE